MNQNHFAIRFLGALAAAAIGINLFLSQSPAPAADTPTKPPANHASLAAYPGAVISLKDPGTGMIFYVESSGRRLVAFDKDAAVKWSVDVIEETKVNPLHGTPVIRDLHLDGDTLGVTYGKSDFAKVQIATGKTEYLGRD